MEFELSIQQFTDLTKRLDSEVRDALRNRLEHNHGFQLPKVDTLAPGVIFAAANGHHRFELLGAYLPITWRNRADSSVSVSVAQVKFLCKKFWVVKHQPNMTYPDTSYGEGGITTFVTDPMDIDGIEPFVDILANHISGHLAPVFA